MLPYWSKISSAIKQKKQSLKKPRSLYQAQLFNQSEHSLSKHDLWIRVRYELEQICPTSLFQFSVLINKAVSDLVRIEKSTSLLKGILVYGKHKSNDRYLVSLEILKSTNIYASHRFWTIDAAELRQLQWWYPLFDPLKVVVHTFCFFGKIPSP